MHPQLVTTGVEIVASHLDAHPAGWIGCYRMIESQDGDLSSDPSDVENPLFQLLVTPEDSPRYTDPSLRRAGTGGKGDVVN